MATGFVVWQASTSPQLSVEAPLSFDGQLIGSPATITIPVKNTHLWKVADIVGVRSSCGCATVESTAYRITPRDNIELSITLRLGAYEDSGSATVYLLHGEQSDPSTFQIATTALPPFRGWPSEAAMRIVGDDFVLDISPEYASILSRVEFASHGSSPELARFDSSTPEIRISQSEVGIDTEDLELILTFGQGADAVVWNGFVTLEGNTSGSSSSRQ